MDRDLWGLSHLWFLQYMFLYVVALAFVRRVVVRFAIASRLQPGPRMTTVIVLVVGSLVLYLRPEVVWGFQHSFIPVPSKWIYSGLFFAFGAMLAAYDGQLSWLMSKASRLAAPAILLLVAAVVLGRWQLAGGDGQLASSALAVLTSGSALLVAVSLIGLAARQISRISTAVSYLAAASFWVYLVHHPIIGLVHLDLKWLFPSASPILKTAAAFCIAGGVCLLTYEGLVRGTALGRLLGMGWELPGSRTDQDDLISIDSGRGGEPAVDQPSRRAA
jgi:peptidoglycan/LPS O-acetylase OafA/YrhL